MATRINTVWCLFDQENLEKPSVQEMFEWLNTIVKDICTNFEAKLLVVQCETNGFYIKFSDSIACDEIIQKLRGESKIRSGNGTIIKLTLQYAGIGIKRIRVLRLPMEISDQKIKAALQKYGEVLSIDDEYWNADLVTIPNLKNGNRVLRCQLTQHIPSYIIIDGYKAMVTYDGHPKTCAYCGEADHLIANCQKRLTKRYNPNSYSDALSRKNISKNNSVSSDLNINFNLDRIPTHTLESSAIAQTPTANLRPTSNELRYSNSDAENSSQINPSQIPPTFLPHCSRSLERASIKRYRSPNNSLNSDVEISAGRNPNKLVILSNPIVLPYTEQASLTDDSDSELLQTARRPNPQEFKFTSSMFEIIKEKIIQDENNLVLPYKQLKKFVLETQKKSDLYQDIKKLNIDKVNLTHTLARLLTMFQDPTAKTKMSKLIQKVKQTRNGSGSDQ